jgi:hypothetical protein
MHGNIRVADGRKVKETLPHLIGKRKQTSLHLNPLGSWETLYSTS